MTTIGYQPYTGPIYSSGDTHQYEQHTQQVYPEQLYGSAAPETYGQQAEAEQPGLVGMLLKTNPLAPEQMQAAQVNGVYQSMTQLKALEAESLMVEQPLPQQSQYVSYQGGHPASYTLQQSTPQPSYQQRSVNPYQPTYHQGQSYHQQYQPPYQPQYSYSQAQHRGSSFAPPPPAPAVPAAPAYPPQWPAYYTDGVYSSPPQGQYDPYSYGSPPFYGYGAPSEVPQTQGKRGVSGNRRGASDVTMDVSEVDAKERADRIRERLVARLGVDPEIFEHQPGAKVHTKRPKKTCC